MKVRIKGLYRRELWSGRQIRTAQFADFVLVLKLQPSKVRTDDESGHS
jgi:hypothetical protein